LFVTAQRIAIIGAGVAGLTAAFTIRRNNPAAHVDVFEASNRVGGAIRTERCGEYLIEHGADMFATEPPAAMQLCKDLGIDGELQMPLSTARGAAIVHKGTLVRIPDGFVLMRPTRLWPMVTTPLLSLRAKLRLLAEPLMPKRKEMTDESIESFVRRRLGSETLDRIVQPLVGGIYTGDVSALSMAATMPQFWEMESRDGSLYRATRRRNREGTDTTEQNSAGARYEKFRSFPHGMERLTQALADQIGRERMHLSTPIVTLNRGENGWALTTASGDPMQEYDHVIIATPAKHAANLLRDAAPDASERLSQIRFASSSVVVLVVREEDMAPTMNVAGFVVPLLAKRKVLAVSFTGDKFEGRTPKGHRLMRIFVGGEMQPELLAQSDDDLIAMVKDELRSLVGLRGEPLVQKVVHWKDAMPQYHVGHLHRLAEIEASIQKLGGLSLIGNSLHGVGIAPTIAHARKVALAMSV
jgi:protoporphyrinogen/coproporphyrinogen III oxidase